MIASLPPPLGEGGWRESLALLQRESSLGGGEEGGANTGGWQRGEGGSGRQRMKTRSRLLMRKGGQGPSKEV